MQILGIGTADSFSQKTFADSLKLPYPLLSDHPDPRVARSYGALSPNGNQAQRSFFLIDRQGVVRGKWLVDNTEVFPSEPILKVAQEIKGKR